MDGRFLFADPLLSTALHHLLDHNEETDKSNNNAPSQKYVRDARAMASTPADVKELPNKYIFTIDIPGVKPGNVSVRIEDDNVLVINGERKREAAEEGMKYLTLERRMGEFMRKFVLPENADVENGINAECKEGVLTVNVMKKPPPEPKKPKTIQVQVA